MKTMIATENWYLLLAMLETAEQLAINEIRRAYEKSIR